jgi:hypothetical protein
MKTLRLALVAFFFCCLSPIFGQYALSTGKMQFNGGISFSGIGWLIAGVDYGFEKNISIGGELSVGTSARGLGSYSSVFGLNANANYHFVELLELEDIFDVYAGLNLGVYTDIALIGLGGQIGGRYYFKKNMAVNVELGGGNVFRGGKVGLSILLN